MENSNINMLSPIRVILAFLAGIAAFAVGFVIGSLLGTLMVKLAIVLPFGIDLAYAASTASSILSFVGGGAVFIAIIKNEKAFAIKCIFMGLMIVFAICYFIGCIVGHTYNLIWYSVLGIGISIYFIYDSYKEKKESKEENNSSLK